LQVLFLLIFISSIPVLAVFIWFRVAKHPFSSVKFSLALLAGAAAVFPALFLQIILPGSFHVTGRWTLFFEIFIRIALTEELSRLLMLFILFWIYNRIGSNKTAGGDLTQPVSFNKFKQATAAGLIAGLGFALLESAIYGASNTGVLLLRAFTTAPLHGACGSRVGAAVIMFRENPVQALSRFLTATVIHGIYNFMIIMPGFPSIAAVLIALSALASSIVLIQSGTGKSVQKV
jgi:RsiW-degrading membrane proteinase PrsW (M82 family)